MKSLIKILAWVKQKLLREERINILFLCDIFEQKFQEKIGASNEI